jgi:magnesium-transporting ATPase (P-type)
MYDSNQGSGGNGSNANNGGYGEGGHRPHGPVPGKGQAIASMVLGICCLVFSFGAFFSIAMAIVGLVLGVISKRKLFDYGAPTGMATAGIIMSIIGLALSVILWIACAACATALFNQNAWLYF